MGYQQPPITKLTDKFLGYCAVTPNKKFMSLFERAGVKNVLVSYHYIRKHPELAKDLLQQVRDRGGLFMTDSGAFSFLNDKDFKPEKFDWQGYVQEYTEWLDQNKSYIFSACNLDVDNYVGADKVRYWNETFFAPLMDDLHIIYVAHKNVFGRGELDAFKEYCNEYDYVAVNEGFKSQVNAIYQTAKITKTNIHGLAWTKPTLLTDNPFFSVDSSSWVNYQKYGATPVFDGTNFSQYDMKNKAIRTTLKKLCDKYDVKHYEFVHELFEGTDKHNDDEGLTFSLRTWLDVFEHIKKFARTKLKTTVGEMLENKQTIFNEPKPVRPARGSLSNVSLGGGVVIGDSKPVTVTEDEDGNDVKTVALRDEKTSIADFIGLPSGNTTARSLLACDVCHVSDKCPKFKEGSECGFDFNTDNLTDDPLKTIEYLIKIQTARVNRSMAIEQLEGGNLNKVYTQEMRILADLNTQKMNIMVTIANKGVNVTKIISEKSEGDNKPTGGFADMLLDALK